MSDVVNLQEPYNLEPCMGLIECPGCGFMIPEELVVCWKCGKRLSS
ncbi:hypothetical protein GF326_01505 [Candidatus Bathyarchaeota archaeon]|nr:hypothetical protein [Candidatus Bathyarchaeota archaeon]